MSRPASIASFDSAAAAEALDLFDEKNTSFRTSKLTTTGAVFGSAPRHRVLADLRGGPSRRESPTLPWRRSTSEAFVRSSTVTPTHLRSSSTAQVQERPGSPDIETILARTPRPRRASSAVFPSPTGTPPRSGKRSQSTFSLRSDAKSGKPTGEDDESIFSISDYGVLLEHDEDDSQSDGDGGSESDSSLDIHTPLPHLMFRDGLLSPRSKLLPKELKPSLYSFGAADKSEDRSRSVMSFTSAAGSVITKSGLQKDPRDTERRRLRHRDGSLLRAGMGLTTGLGWSDSEDEDAPSALTRRLISTTLDRKRSASMTFSSRPSSQYEETSLSRFASPAPTSRFTSPVPSSRQSLSRKTSGSHLGMRSLSVSQIQTRAVTFPSTSPKADKKLPTTPEEVPTSRTRTSSTASTTSRAKTPLPSATGTPTSPTRKRTTSSASSSQPTRSRAGSIVSIVASSSGVVSRSRTVSSASTTQSHISRMRSESSASSTSHSIPSMPRPGAESLTSASTTSLASTSSTTTSSLHSSSTASASSGSVVPRPLRLPQSVIVRSFSHDPTTSTTSSFASPSDTDEAVGTYQRARTLSGPRPRPPQPRSPTPTQSQLHSQHMTYTPSAPQRTFTYPQPTTSSSIIAHPSSMYTTAMPSTSTLSTPSLTDASTTPSTSTSSPISPSSQSSPTSPGSLRQRPTLIGARPKPRTGTGMAYRTSSFPNLQASALKMRTLATGPTPVSMAAEGGGYPLRI